MEMMRQQQRRGGFNSGPSGFPSGPSRGAYAVIGLGVAAVAAYKCLFNVDGGHRAIMYKRTSGVSSHIYGEGA